MNNIESSKGEIVMYQPDETIRLEVRMDEETVWLTQQQMAELFQKDQSVVARHINNAFKEGELDENSNMHFLHNTRYKSGPASRMQARNSLPTSKCKRLQQWNC